MLTLNSTPPGVVAIIDGKPEGITPVTVSIPSGTHDILLRRGSEEKRLAVKVNPGSEIIHHVEFAAVIVTNATGSLAVTTEPSGARVTVDGSARGASPLVLQDLSPGEHIVGVSSDAGTAQKKISIEAGVKGSVVFTLAPKAAGPSAGWLAVAAPFDVQVFEGNDLIGVGSSAKIMVSAGRHDLRLTSTAVGYDETRRVDVKEGKVATLNVTPPKTSLSANARPWADVLVDGVAVGQTPVANLVLSVGSHQIVFRHPELGEQRQTVMVTSKGPNRVSADMNKKPVAP